MPYTQEEEGWLNYQICQMETAFRSVSIGEELLNEFTMYSLGVPLSKSYMKTALSFGMERVWRMFKTHSEFTSLPTVYQGDILAQRGMVVLCILLVKFGSYDTGIEQLQFAFSQYDEEIWNGRFKLVFEKTELQKLGVFESSYELPVLLTHQQKVQMLHILDAASLLLKDPLVYGLILLLTVSEPGQELAMGPLAQLNSKYKILMQRRFSSTLSKNEGKLNKTFQHPKDLMNKVSIFLTQMEQMAGMLQLLAAARQSCSEILTSSTSTEN
jgi:hypothetical protein